MNIDTLIETLKAEIANNSYRETPISLTNVVDVNDVYETIDEFKNYLLHSVSERNDIKRKLDEGVYSLRTYYV